MQQWTLNITQPIFGISRFLANEASNVTFYSFFVVLMLLAFRKSNSISKWGLKKINLNNSL